MRFQLYCTTRSEADKSLLTLSTAGLGLIVTLLTGDEIASIFELVLFILGALCFGVCIFAILTIFNRNADYIAQKDSDDKQLINLDSIAKYAFRLGIAITALGAITVSINNLTNNIKDKAIDEYKQSEPQSKKTSTTKNMGTRQLGRSELNIETDRETQTTEQQPKEGREEMTKERIELINTSEVEIKRSWEGANSILDTPPQEQSNDSGSSDSSSEKE
ncbi:hypothetical protein [Shewanella nanhaiensis]|nr:hypothetical protein [Shewanella nanhaiensis]